MDSDHAEPGTKIIASSKGIINLDSIIRSFHLMSHKWIQKSQIIF